MAKQIETRSRAENEISLMLLGHDTKGQVISGGLIENFEKGWAIQLGSFGKAHHFKLANMLGGYIALCGQWTYRPLYGAGNFPKCKRCEKAVKHG